MHGDTHTFLLDLTAFPPPQTQNTHTTTQRQAVLSLSLGEWQELCRAYAVDEAHVPHRPGYKKGEPSVVLDAQRDSVGVCVCVGGGGFVFVG